MTSNAKLGFEFYGTGNVGDDLMLEGFLSICPPNLNVFGVAEKKRHGILTRRFPSVHWLRPGESEPTYTHWLGVGDTPFQSLSGDYFLRQMEEEILPLAKSVHVALIGVGVEKESIVRKERFQKLINRMDLITTRDDEAYDFLTGNFDVASIRIEKTADLAHLFLHNLSADPPEEENRIYDLAVNYYGEKCQTLPLFNIFRRLFKLNKDLSVIFLANEFRNFKRSESRLYQLSGLLAEAARDAAFPSLITPAYFARETRTLTEVFQVTNRLASSRYHTLLCGAWLGCRCLGLTRSSKISTLCRELEIHLCSPAEFAHGLTAFEDLPFKPVDPNLLQSYYQRAIRNRTLLADFVS